MYGSRMGRNGTHNRMKTPRERKFKRRRIFTRMGEGAKGGRVDESQVGYADAIPQSLILDQNVLQVSVL